jgi:hypothetical protein
MVALARSISKLDDANERKKNWVVAPTSAVRPGGQRADHEEDKDDKDNETHGRGRPRAR